VQIEGITKRVAEELQISIELSEEVCRSEFKFILQMIKEGKTCINCIHLGKFYTKKNFNGTTRHTKNIPGI
jgi:hypothetical protein